MCILVFIGILAGGSMQKINKLFRERKPLLNENGINIQVNDLNKMYGL